WADRPPRGRHQAPLPLGAVRHRRRRSMALNAAPGPGQELRPLGSGPRRHAVRTGKGHAMSKLQLKTEGDTHVVVTRRFAASPEAVFRAHTETELIQKWLLGPDGWSMTLCINEARPGGKIHYAWSNGKGGGFSLTGEYRELVPFSRIVHVERMHLPD